ncbi:hypothetical protein DEO72_LG3g986 [Vigna unguiculata]|uniref:Uncharacterized protein n=1 Tax=Vigna unguiculata TaxID=3917 RepID=A0A4D6LD96_VIGUN|nr:hypothetical protein DEO72_LG3g986 [Vigna unguiculata]
MISVSVLRRSHRHSGFFGGPPWLKLWIGGGSSYQFFGCLSASVSHCRQRYGGEKSVKCVLID